jgi:hypothetical protein
VEAAKAVVSAGTPTALMATASSDKALDWLTCDADEFPYTGGQPQSPFGRFLRVRGLRWTEGDEVQWIPLAFIPEVLSYAIGELAHEAASSREVQNQICSACSEEVRKSLWSFGTVTYGPQYQDSTPVPVRDNAVQWVSLTTANLRVVAPTPVARRWCSGALTTVRPPTNRRHRTLTAQSAIHPRFAGAPPPRRLRCPRPRGRVRASVIVESEQLGQHRH